MWYEVVLIALIFIVIVLGLTRVICALSGLCSGISAPNSFEEEN